MKQCNNKIIAIVTILLIISVSFIPTSTALIKLYSNPISIRQLLTDEQKELYLLRVEHYLELEAISSTDAFSVKYAFPPDYGYQVPIVMEILNNTTADIISYSIEKDITSPNRIVNFSLSSMQEGQHELLHFTIWVLVKDHDFSDISENIDMPISKYENPEETHQWLSSSDMVQVKRLRIRRTAESLEGKNDNILSYAKNVSYFIKYHRYSLFLLQLWTRTFFKQDALTTLKINGENVGRSHLACALFRSQNIPARVILAHNDQGFWTQMHYMVEYYIPEYGWVLLDSTKGVTPYETHRQIINRICSIADEDDTKTDYIYRSMKGVERWIWIDTENVLPYYIDCDTGSKSLMFTEQMVKAQEFATDYTFFRTQNVFSQYEKFLGASLSTEDKEHLNQATSYQIEACNKLIETKDITEYIFYIEKAYDEYKEIST